MDASILRLIGMYAALNTLIDRIEYRELCEATEWDGSMKWLVPYRARYQFAVPERIECGDDANIDF